MGHNVWLYHNEHGSKIFDSDEADEQLSNGWVDLPAKFESTENMTEEEAAIKRGRGRPRKVEE